MMNSSVLTEKLSSTHLLVDNYSLRHCHVALHIAVYVYILFLSSRNDVLNVLVRLRTCTCVFILARARDLRVTMVTITTRQLWI